MHAAGPKNPLHGITLEMMVTQLQAFYGWEMMGRMIKINCFNWQPSVRSSLTFLRKTPWARQKVEELYIETLPDLKSGKSFDELYSTNPEENESEAPTNEDAESAPAEAAPEPESSAEQEA